MEGDAAASATAGASAAGVGAEQRRLLLTVLGAIAFAWVATLNSGGYRYGASDQAFYIPAIQRQLSPTLFPRDAALIDSQSRLFVLDELLAGVESTLHVGLPALFAAGYLVTVGLLFLALYLLGRAWLNGPWSVAAFLAASALRHRIAKTGANTMEGYFHPRLLAFAIGLLAVRATLAGRSWLAFGLVGAAALVHPTTAVWFAIWVGVAVAVEDARARPFVLLLGVSVALVGAWFIWRGPLGLSTMDAAWVRTLADKDYVFPTAWPVSAWALNMLYPLVILASFLARRSRGVALPHEAGIVSGCLALVLVFLCSLPFIAAHVALAVQLQVSRVFWMADVLATVYLVWWVCDAGQRSTALRARRVAVVLMLIALGRGWYVLRVGHPGRPMVGISLPADAWTDASAWLRRTPPDAHVLADPGHAWRYGSSLRVSAMRDVFLEDVKDGSIGMYDRGVALRVAERRAALPDFAGLSPESARALAARYDLDYLISERPFPFPEVYRNERFYIYKLGT